MQAISLLFVLFWANLSFGLSQFTLKPFDQEALDQYNVLRFLGTASPYVSNPGYGIPRDPPSICNVTQANVITRHGERYPTASKGKKIIKNLEAIRNISEDVQISGPLAFLRDYDFPALDEDRFDSETNSGPYSGLVDLYTFGSKFRTRYSDLYDAISDKTEFKFYSASQQRVIDSAIKFAEGFLGQAVNESSIVIIDEDDDNLGANSLTPSTSCLAYNDSINDELVDQYSDKYLEDIADRFNTLSPEVNFTKKEVKGLLDYVGFDLNVAGRSQVAEIFTNDELLARAYYNDLGYYYSKGPGHNLTTVLGSVYAEAIANLLSDEDINLTISFAHDTDLFHIYSLLGIFDSGELPIDYIDFNAQWKTSNIAPMGARLISERLECEGYDEPLLRLVVNDAVVPIPGRSSGPGFSTPLDDFKSYINERLDGRSYAEDCELKDGAPTNLTFYWDN